MDVKKAIEIRASIRKYQDKEVSDRDLNEVINAARLAPSGNNAQPWRFKIIKDEKIKEELKVKRIFKQDFVYSAPVIIVCCADPKAYPEAKFEPAFDDPYETRAIRDLSIASQNLVLRATELGMGTCYVGWLNKEGIKKVLKLPKRYIVPYVITVGYPAEKSIRKSRKDMSEIVF